jgi:hypothetical protein
MPLDHLVLRLDGVPDDASVVVDGVRLAPGVAQGGLGLGPGRHRIAVHRPGVPPISVTLDVPVGSASGYFVVPR